MKLKEPQAVRSGVAVRGAADGVAAGNGIRIHTRQTGDGATLVIEQTGAWLDGRFVYVDDARDYLQHGNFIAAERVFRALLDRYPQSGEVGLHFSDFLIARGRLGDAYRVLVDFCVRGSDPKLLLRASLVCASLGEVYQGQLEYCEQHIVFMESLASSRATAIPTFPSPRNLQILSLMALGVDSFVTGQYAEAKRFLVRARGLDPTNPITVSLLATIYHREGEYIKERDALQAGYPRSRGYLREDIRSDLERVIQIIG